MAGLPATLTPIREPDPGSEHARPTERCLTPVVWLEALVRACSRSRSYAQVCTGAVQAPVQTCAVRAMPLYMSRVGSEPSVWTSTNALSFRCHYLVGKDVVLVRLS